MSSYCHLFTGFVMQYSANRTKFVPVCHKTFLYCSVGMDFKNMQTSVHNGRRKRGTFRLIEQMLLSSSNGEDKTLSPFKQDTLIRTPEIQKGLLAL